MEIQTAVTADLRSKQVPLFVFGQQILGHVDKPFENVISKSRIVYVITALGLTLKALK